VTPVQLGGTPERDTSERFHRNARIGRSRSAHIDEGLARLEPEHVVRFGGCRPVD
jgi:hypothetical protein